MIPEGDQGQPGRARLRSEAERAEHAQREIEPGAEAERRRAARRRSRTRRRARPRACVPGTRGTTGESPRPGPHRRGRRRSSTYASGAPTNAGRQRGRHDRGVGLGAQHALEPGPVREIWAIATGMPAMTDATTTRQKTIRERASARADVIGRRGMVPAEDRRGHRPALDRGDQERRPRPAMPSRPYQTPAPPSSTDRSWARSGGSRRPRAPSSPARSGPIVTAMTAPM